MKRIAITVGILVLVVSSGSSQEFKRFSLGVGYGSLNLTGLYPTPSIHGTGTKTITVTSGNTSRTTTSTVYEDFSGFDNYHTSQMSFPFSLTYRLNENLGFRASVSLLKGYKDDKGVEGANINDVDTTYQNGMRDTIITTTAISGTGNTNAKEDFSGFPFEFEVLPLIHFGEKIVFIPSAGIGYYNYTAKGAASNYTFNEREDDTRREIRNPPGGGRTDITMATTTTTNYTLSGRLPEMKYTGISAFFSLGAEITVLRQLSLVAQWRKGRIPLREKYTDTWTVVVFPDQRSITYNNQYNRSVHVQNESFILGAAYNF